MPMSESRLKQLNDEIYTFKEPNIAERIQIFDEVRNLLRHVFTRDTKSFIFYRSNTFLDSLRESDLTSQLKLENL